MEIQNTLKFLTDYSSHYRDDIFTIKKIFVDIYKHITTLCSAIIAILFGFVGHYKMADRELLIISVLGFGLCILLGVLGMYYSTITLNKISSYVFSINNLVSEYENYKIFTSDIVVKATAINNSQDEASVKQDKIKALENDLQNRQTELQKARMQMQQEWQVVAQSEKTNLRIQAWLFSAFASSILFILVFIILNI